MAFEGLKDQLRENWADLSAKIQENSTFNSAREKFEAQSPTVQKGIVAGIAVLAGMFLLSFPWGYVSSSQDHMAEFEENRELIQGLLHASRAAKEPSPLPPPVSPEQIKSQVDVLVRENRLLPEQIGDVAPVPDKPAKDLVPAVVTQNGLNVQLKKLNLEQVIAMSLAFQNMGPGMKLMGLDVIQSASQTHYYDMIAHIVHFGLQPVQFIEEPDEPKKGSKGKKPSKPRASEEEGGE